MGFAARFFIFALGTILGLGLAPEKLRQPGRANTAAIWAWFLMAGAIFLP